jgi:hypothetical protein
MFSIQTTSEIKNDGVNNGLLASWWAAAAAAESLRDIPTGEMTGTLLR